MKIHLTDPIFTNPVINPYGHLERLSWQILEIDEITMYASLSMGI